MMMLGLGDSSPNGLVADGACNPIISYKHLSTMNLALLRWLLTISHCEIVNLGYIWWHMLFFCFWSPEANPIVDMEIHMDSIRNWSADGMLSMELNTTTENPRFGRGRSCHVNMECQPRINKLRCQAIEHVAPKFIMINRKIIGNCWWTNPWQNICKWV